MPVPQFNDGIIIGLMVISTVVMLFFVIVKFREK